MALYGSSMTGSGSCIFGIFDSKEASKKAYRSIRNLHETYWTVAWNN